MSNVKDGDIFMVSRDGTEFQVKNEDTSNLRDTDLFWVQREGVNYSVTADQVNTGGDAGPPELSLVTLSKTTTGDRYTDQSFLTVPSYTAPGNPPPTIGLKAEVTGALSIAGASDEIVGTSVGTNYTDTSTFTDVGTETQYKAFDGDLSTYWTLDLNPIKAEEYGTITFNPPINVNSKVEIYINASWNISSSTYIQQYAYNGGAYQQIGNTSDSNAVGAAQRWVTVSTGAGVMTSLTCGRITGNTSWGCSFATAIRVDGKILTDGAGAIFTLASDASLETFKAGDAVKQNNSPIVPTSSEITNVGDVSGWNQSEMWSSMFTTPASLTGTDTRAFDGTTGQQGGYWSGSCT